MRELACCDISAVAISFVPIVAEGFSLTVSARLLPFALAFAFAFTTAFSTFWSGPALLPKPLWGVLVNLPISRFAGRVSRSVARYSASIAPHLSYTRLSVPVHDGEAGVSFLPTTFVHLNSSSFCELVGVDEFETELGIVR